MKFFKLPQKELEYMATLKWDPLMEYLENKYGIEYKEEVKKRLDSVIQKRRTEKTLFKKMSINDESREKWK
ncbi:MAG: hypothetical protein OPY07_01840 [Nitrosopumilus sp.]|nr:hypothetical protein [Nitrosopumilus sp.]MDF2429667.1 hypothetical protein [Nitrosopumilus sp.]